MSRPVVRWMKVRLFANLRDMARDRVRRDIVFVAKRCRNLLAVEVAAEAVALESTGRARVTSSGITICSVFDGQGIIVVGACRVLSRLVAKPRVVVVVHVISVAATDVIATKAIHIGGCRHHASENSAVMLGTGERDGAHQRVSTHVFALSSRFHWRPVALSRLHRSCSPVDRSLSMTKQISPLRHRMIDDMASRNMSPNTQKVYTYALANFAQFHRQSPDQLGVEHVRDYRLHLMARGLKATSINPIVGALRFFYGTTLGNPQMAQMCPTLQRLRFALQ